MRVYYYDHPVDGSGECEGINWVLVCCQGNAPGKLSPVWSQTSASVWIVPGTVTEEESDEG